MTIDQAMELAVQHHQAGRLTEAERLYREILGHQPDHAPALHLLGVLSAQRGQRDDAERMIRQAIRISPAEASYHSNLGKVLQDKGLVTQAITAVREAVRLNPNLAEAHANLGSMLETQGQRADALAAFRAAIQCRPNVALFHNYLGISLQAAGRLDEALAAYQQAVRLEPQFPEPYGHMGDIYRSRAAFDSAINCYQTLIRLQPDSADAYNWLGTALCGCGRIDDAAAALRRAIQLKPVHVEALSNLGLTLHIQGHLDEASACLREALRIDPDFAPAHNNLGNVSQSQGRIDDALACFRRAAELQPDDAAIGSNLLFTLHYHPASDGPGLLAEARRWSERHAEPLTLTHPPHANDRHPDRRLRIGYVSPDFMTHPVSSFLRPLFAAHDHQHFEIFCYSDVVSPDQTTAALQRSADSWRVIVGQSDEAVADLMRQDQIDILVDLAGHTKHNRLLVFARKPAPLQVSYLGYPGTTGMSAMDYRLTDALADPEGQTDSFHTEKLWRLPATNWCFAAPELSPDVTPPPSANVNGPGRSICFACFNNFAKASPTVLDLWAQILKAVPASQLLLKARGLHDPATQHHIRESLASRGIEPQRILMQGTLADHSLHLAMYSAVDIALDTHPYHGTTTTCEALWMGVPVISLAGALHVSRVGASLLTQAGLPDLIARSPDQYVALAVALAANTPRLVELRRSLRDQMRKSPLMDGPRFALDVESAYRAMWCKWCADPPRRIATEGAEGTAP